MTLSIDERIKAIEERLGLFVGGRVPGTTLMRVMSQNPMGGTEWCLSIGQIHLPKRFFNSKTIEDCIRQAEEAIKDLPQVIQKDGEVKWSVVYHDNLVTFLGL